VRQNKGIVETCISIHTEARKRNVILIWRLTNKSYIQEDRATCRIKIFFIISSINEPDWILSRKKLIRKFASQHLEISITQRNRPINRRPKRFCKSCSQAILLTSAHCHATHYLHNRIDWERWCYISRFLIHVTRNNFWRNFVAATVGNGMLHETIFNETFKIRATVLPQSRPVRAMLR